MTDNINQNQNEVKPFSWWERLKHIFISPSIAFENIKHYPKVLFPMITILIGMIVITLPKLNMMKEFMREDTIRQYAQLGMEVPSGMDTIVSVGVYAGIVGLIIGIIVTWLVKSTLINAFSGFVNGTGTFKQALSVITYSYLPVFLGNIIVTIISLITKQNEILTSLAVFLPDSQAGTVLYTILANLDIFVIWYQILAIIGISKVYSVSKKSSSILVLGTWIVSILFSVSLVVLGSKITGLV
ncbi:MAG: YIP1 family protein [Tissierellales bacterium]